MKIAFIGFGEAGQAFVTNWSAEHRKASSGFDLKSGDKENGMTARYAQFDVTECFSCNAATAEADVIFSLVTADEAINAATACKALIPNALFLDCNSVSPGTKRVNAATIQAAGGRYVDVAVMAPVYPALNKVPLLPFFGLFFS